MNETRFLPFARRQRLSGDVITVRAEGRDVPFAFHRYGPGDVAKLTVSQIRRREPVPGSEAMPPNLFPYVEFAQPDFPWRLSPVSAEANGRLMPWLALITLEAPADAPSPLRRAGQGELPVVEVECKALPTIGEYAMWAHVEVAPEGAVNTEAGIARIISPARLKALTRYVCCLVPTFEAGRLAGLGETPPDPLAPELAWTKREGMVILPVYESWQFTTMADGDLETLARNLQPALLAAQPFQADMTEALRAVGASAAPPIAIAPFDAVLRPSAANVEWSPKTARQEARTVIGQWLTGSAMGAVGPPVYGAMVTGGVKLDADWMGEVNLDPVMRAAAGLGAAMARAHQDELAEEVWRQAGVIHKARREREGASLASLVANRLHARRIAPLEPSAATLTLAPALARTAAADGGAVTAALERSALPSANLSAAYRRILRAKLRKSAGTSSAALPVALQSLNQKVAILNALPPTNSGIATRARIAVFQSAGSGLTGPLSGTVLSGGGLTTETADTPTAGTGGSGTSETVGAGTAATATISAAARRAARIATLNLFLDAEKSQILEAAEVLLDDRAPAVVQLQTPPAFAWASPPRPGGRAIAAAGLRADLGGAGRYLPGRGVSVAPSFDQPLVDWLDPQFLLGKIAPAAETVSGLGVNARFIEGLMIGANHEIARELRWRGVPLDLSTTFFRRFFEGRVVMSEMAGWATTPIGDHYPVAQSTVIFFRSKLVDHLSEVAVFLVRGRWVPGSGRVVDAAAATVPPFFQGKPGPGMAYFGFDISQAALRGDASDGGWYLVIEERSGSTKFGFDERNEPVLRRWDDVAWSDVDATAGYVNALDNPEPPAPAPAETESLQWGRNGAHMAAISRQKPFRLVIHASLLLG